MDKPNLDSKMSMDFSNDRTTLKLMVTISSENVQSKHAPSEIDAVERELDLVLDYLKTKLRDNMRR